MLQVLVGSAITTVERSNPGLRLLNDTRSEAGALTAFGTATFPATARLPRIAWLNANAETAGRLVRAVRKVTSWLTTHSAEQVREAMPESLRMPERGRRRAGDSAHSSKFLSLDGAMPADAPETVRRFVALSNERVRAAHIDLTELYTNQFVTSR